MVIKRFLISILGAMFVHAPAMAQVPPIPEKTRANFMVVVRESMGANRTQDSFVPTGKGKAILSNGQEIELELAYWEFIGDTHIRFAFDGTQSMIDATPRDLEQLGLKSVDEALSLALANLKRVYGNPKASPWEFGLMSVEGQSPDLNSSYFLDRAYWNGLLKAHPEGLVVCVPKRGGLLYTPRSNLNAVEGLKRAVAYLHSSSEHLRVSSALFLFKGGHWSVFQAPVPQ